MLKKGMMEERLLVGQIGSLESNKVLQEKYGRRIDLGF
jgi:hypothetical protein